MSYVADLHIHSRYSRACGKDLGPETLHRWCQLKGIGLLSTGDFTHPAYFAELKEKLVPAEDGLFVLRRDRAEAEDRLVPASCRSQPRFILGVEISCIYKKGRVRKVHHLIFAPSFEAAARLSASLARIGNIGSDGRPILGLDSRDLLEMALDASADCVLVPAHAWTPHFAVFGSESGFDSLEECFEDLAPRVFAIETGLSSDPPMNWRVSGLDRLALLSNSDAHSLEKLGREATVVNAALSYAGLWDAVRGRRGAIAATLEFFPAEGKYHEDGHRACGVRLRPEETRRRGGLCPSCGRAVTVGVLHRIERLADRGPGIKPPRPVPFENLVPLKEVLGEILGVAPSSVRVDREYTRLLAALGPELRLLREVSPEEALRAEAPKLAEALARMRSGRIRVEPGFDGQYGRVRLLDGPDPVRRAPRKAALPIDLPSLLI